MNKRWVTTGIAIGMGLCLLQPVAAYAKKTKQVITQVEIAKEKKWGFGVILVNPTGITAKYWRDKNVAMDFALGSQWNAPGVGIHADYLYHLYLFEEMPEAPLYIGGGMFLGGSGDYFTTGGRGVVGWTYLFDQPFDVFMELSPPIAIIPEVDFGFSFSIGARLYI